MGVTLLKILVRLLPILSFVIFQFGLAQAQQPPQAQQPDKPFNLNLGDAVVTGFSGTAPDPTKRRSRDQSPSDITFINPDGPSVRIIDVSRPGYVWDGRLFAAPKKFDVLAKDVGQVFGVALDDATPPNIYVAATSVFGLNIVSRGRDGTAERKKKGGPGAGWMKGQFGLDLQGGPGAIYKIDGRTGVPTLFANATLDGVPNPGPGLGNLAYDSAHKQLFVSDLYTGMIHRFDLTGKELGSYDHGVTGLGAAKLATTAFNPKNRPNIATDRFDSEKPDTWGFAPAARRVWGLAVHDGRLYYSVVSGPQIWSVGIERDGGFAADPRWELDVPAQSGPLPVSDIAFSQQGAMLLAQRALIAGSYDYSAFTRPGEPQVLRFWQKTPNDPPSPGRWKLVPEEYAVGFAGNLRNTNGSVALGYGYGQDGALTQQSCEASLWTTGQNLRNNPALRSQLEPGGPLVVHGLQGSPANLIRRGNDAPATSYFIDYRDTFADPRASGHIGSVRIYTTPCAPGAYAQPVAVADVTPVVFPGCVGPNCRAVCTPTCVCPAGTELKGRECVKTNVCPAPMVQGPAPGQCVCPQGYAMEDHKCIRVISMPPNTCKPPMVPGPTPGSCHCPLDTQLVNGRCVRPNECRPPFVPGKKPGSCVCREGTVLQNGQCVAQVCQSPLVPGPCTCPEGTVRDGEFCMKATPIDLKVEKTGATSPPPNVPWYTWHLKVTNVGGAINANGIITVTDIVPAGMAFDSATSSPPTNWTCNAPPSIPAGGTLTCTYNGGPVTAGQVLSTIDIVARATGQGPYKPFTNCATVGTKPGSDYVDSNTSNDESCVTVSKPGLTGELILKKEVVNLGAIMLPDLGYPVTVNCGGADTNLTLHNNIPQTVGGLTLPTTCTVVETPPPPPSICPPNTTPTWATNINPSSPVPVTTSPTTVTVKNTFSCAPKGGQTGTLNVTKVVTNDTEANVSAVTFPVTVTCGGTTTQLTIANAQTLPATGPVGSTCTVTETLPANPTTGCGGGRYPVWQPAAVSPLSATIPSSGTATVTITNHLMCERGGYVAAIKKVTNNTQANLSGVTYPVQFSCSGGGSPFVRNETLTPGVVDVMHNIGSGQTCTPLETLPPAPTTGCPAGSVPTWASPVYTPPTVTSAVGTGQTITIQNQLDCKPILIGTPVPTSCTPPKIPGAKPDSCVCPSGTMDKDGTCVLVNTCTPPQVANPDGSCKCPAPMTPGAVPGQCMCPQASKLVDGKCVPDRKTDDKKKKSDACPAGTVKQNGKCVKRESGGPRVTPDDVIRGIGIINGIGGGGRGGGDRSGGGDRGGGGSKGGGSPGKPY